MCVCVCACVCVCVCVCVAYRYKMLSTKTWPKWKGRPKDGVKEIMKVSQSQLFSVLCIPAWYVLTLAGG